MIKIICLGKIKEQYLSDLIEDYQKRIQKYHKISIVELKDENDLSKEAKSILNCIGPKDYVIACDINGQKMDSIEFAKKLDSYFIKSSNVVFIIGSSYGLDLQVKKRANASLSFSDMTLPHGLFRGVLLEQIYRAFKINNNESYHK